MTSAEHINTTVKKVTSYSTIYSSNVDNNLRLIDGGLDSPLSINDSCLTDWSDSFPYPNSVGVPDYCASVIESLCPDEVSQRTKDKLYWLCDEIYNLSLMNLDLGAPMNARYVRARIGGKKIDLLNDLVSYGLIEKCENYSAGLKCRRYRFTRRESLCMVGVKLVTPFLISKRGSKYEFWRARLIGGGLSAKSIDDLLRFRPSHSFKLHFNSWIGDQIAKGKDTITMECLRDFILGGGIRFSPKNSRIYHQYCSLPKSLRKYIRVDGKPTVEKDIKNSHPCLLPTIYSPPDYASEDVIDEHQELINLVSCDFYKKFEDCWLRDRKTFLDYATKDAKTEETKELASQLFLANTRRKGIKLCWQVMLNGSSDPERLFYTNMWTKFSDMFPNVAARMSQDRRKRPRRLGDELRRREAVMMIEVTSRMKSPCITIYDSFLCAKDAQSELMNVCREVMPKHLGFIHLPR